MLLKSSPSKRASVSAEGVRRQRASSSSMRVSNARRFGAPVRESVVASDFSWSRTRFSVCMTKQNVTKEPK